MLHGIAGSFVRWWVLSLTLHLAVIGGLVLSPRLRPETPGAVQVVLISLSDGRPGTGPAGGGSRRFAPKEATAAPGSAARKSHRTVEQKAPTTAGRAMKPDESLARPEVAKPPSRKPETETARPNISQKREVQTKHEHPTTRPLASAAPSPRGETPKKTHTLPRQEAMMSSGLTSVEEEHVQDGSRPPEGERVDETETQRLTFADGDERSSASGTMRSSHDLVNLGGGPGWGRGGGHGSGIGTGTGPGAGLGVGGGTDWRLLILERIHRAKRYPPLARQWGMEGTAVVQFRIAGDGSVEDVALVQSSGFPLLDRASVETIKRAAPLPVIPGTIHIPISYRLRNGQ